MMGCVLKRWNSPYGPEVRVVVVQVHHEAHRHQIGAVVVEERAAARAVVERPAQGVLHQARPVLLGGHLPQLLEAEAVLLRLAALVEAEPGDQHLGERAARALGDHRVFGPELDATLKPVGRLAVLADALVARGDADDGAAVVVERLRDGELGVDIHAQLGGLLAEPAHHVAEAHDVVAVVAHQRRHHQVGDADGAGRPQVVEAVLRHLRLDRRALGLPVRHQRVEADGVDDRAREDVGAHLRALLQDDDGELLPGRSGELLEADGGREPGRPRPDDHHVALHRFARLQLGCVGGHGLSLSCHWD